MYQPIPAAAASAGMPYSAAVSSSTMSTSAVALMPPLQQSASNFNMQSNVQMMLVSFQTRFNKQESKITQQGAEIDKLKHKATLQEAEIAELKKAAGIVQPAPVLTIAHLLKSPGKVKLMRRRKVQTQQQKALLLQNLNAKEKKVTPPPAAPVAFSTASSSAIETSVQIDHERNAAAGLLGILSPKQAAAAVIGSVENAASFAQQVIPLAVASQSRTLGTHYLR